MLGARRNANVAGMHEFAPSMDVACPPPCHVPLLPLHSLWEAPERPHSLALAPRLANRARPPWTPEPSSCRSRFSPPVIFAQHCGLLLHLTRPPFRSRSPPLPLPCAQSVYSHGRRCPTSMAAPPGSPLSQRSSLPCCPRHDVA
jgi:hypothetical protein